MAVVKDIDINLIDMVEVNEDIFGYEDLDFLADDIEEEGFHGTIEVYAKKNGRYEISAGHRRYLAAKKNNMKTIPCSIEEDTDNITKAKRLIMSNIHQRKMSPYNWAKALEYYRDNVIKPEREKNKGKNVKDKSIQGSTKDILAKAFNLTASVVQRYLALLKLIPEYNEFIKDMNCNYTNYELLSYQPEDIQKEVFYNLKEMAVNGDINTLSRTLIDQTVNRTIIKREKDKQKEIEIKESAMVTEKNFSNLSDVPSTNFLNPPVNDIESFSSEMNDEFDHDDQWLEEEESTTTYSVDGEVGYYISRINLILNNNNSVINDKENIVTQLENLIKRINA